MSRIVRGVKTIATGAGLRIHPVDGSSSSLIIEGEAQDVLGLVNSFPGAEVEVNRGDDGQARLEVRYGTIQGQPDVPVYIWELVWNDQQKDIRFNPAALALGHESLALIQDALDNGLESVALTDDELALYVRILRGETAYLESMPVLRRTIALSDQGQVQPAVSGINKLFTTAAIIASEPTMDVAVKELILAVDAEMATRVADADYPFSWLKKGPGTMVRWGQKREITQEWIGDFWDTLFAYAEA